MITEETIIRSLQGRTTPEEEARLRVWREVSPENDKAYRAIAELWSLVGVASREPSPAPARDEIAGWIARADDEPVVVLHGRKNGVRDPRTRWVPRPLATGLLAASLAVVSLGLGALAHRFLSDTDSLAFQEVVTGAGERTTVTLSDGTAVRLGPESTIRILEGDPKDPVVWLEGRAFFGVVPDPTRAFTVRTEYGDAMALGTRFEVRTDEEEFRVLVLEGNVRVSTAGNSLELGEGLMSRSAEGGDQAMSRVEDLYEQLEWVGSTLVFRATPLARVVSEIERHYGVSIDMEDSALRERTVTATFTEQEVEEVLFVVCQIVGAGCAEEDGHYRIGDMSLGTLEAVVVERD